MVRALHRTSLLEKFNFLLFSCNLSSSKHFEIPWLWSHRLKWCVTKMVHLSLVRVSQEHQICPNPLLMTWKIYAMVTNKNSTATSFNILDHHPGSVVNKLTISYNWVVVQLLWIFSCFCLALFSHLGLNTHHGLNMSPTSSPREWPKVCTLTLRMCNFQEHTLSQTTTSTCRAQVAQVAIQSCSCTNFWQCNTLTIPQYTFVNYLRLWQLKEEPHSKDQGRKSSHNPEEENLGGPSYYTILCLGSSPKSRPQMEPFVRYSQGGSTQDYVWSWPKLILP